MFFNCNVSDVSARTRWQRSVSSINDFPNDGTSSARRLPQAPWTLAGKQCLITSRMTQTAVDAPGEAPKRVTNEPSSDLTSSVPNFSKPRFSPACPCSMI